MQNKTYIQLIEGTKGILETNDETSIPLTISVSDIKDLSKRKGTFSKSVTILGTKNNNMVLGNYFDVNVLAGTFDINKVVKCAVIQDGIIIMDNAIIQLISVNRTQTNSMTDDRHTFTLLIKDVQSDFFSVIANKKLEDIDLSYMNHKLTADKVVETFDNTIIEGYKYVMPFNPMTEDDAKFYLTEFTPAVFARRYFDSIFADAGYSYSWISSNDPINQFDKLVVPYNGDGKLGKPKEVDDFRVKAYTNTTQSTINPLNPFNGAPISVGRIVDIPTKAIAPYIETSDMSNVFNPTTGVYSTPAIVIGDNYMRLKAKVTYSIDEFNGAPSLATLNFYNPNNLLASNNPLTLVPYLDIIQTINGENTVVQRVNLDLKAFKENVTLSAGHTLASGLTKQLAKTQVEFIVDIEGLDYSLPFKIGRGLEVRVGNGADDEAFYYARAPLVSDLYKIKLNLESIDINLVPVVTNIGYNSDVSMNDFIPRNVKQSDFLKGIFTMFNVYAEIDKNNQNQINLENRDAFYDKGKNKDWSQKLVKDKDQDIKFLPEIANKKLLLTYKEDKDWANKQYTEETGKIFGEALYTFDNEYVIGTTKVETIFSPTPMMNTAFGAVTPIWEGGAPKTNIRILYDGGKLQCAKYQIWNYSTMNSTTDTPLTTTFYPLISHWDKPSSPTFDLNFLSPKQYFRTDEPFENTSNNLFNMHWRRTMSQINTGKLLTVYIQLNPADIADLSLSDKIRIDNSWWNINTIKDYDANSNKPTKVELISVDEELAIEYIKSTSIGTNLGSPVLGGFSTMNQIRRRNKIMGLDIQYVSGFNNFVTGGVKGSSVIGDSNFIGSEAVLIGNHNAVSSPSVILGSNNTIRPNTKSLIVGDGNTIGEGLQNVLIFGNNIEALSGNTMYTDNIVLSSGSSINGVLVEDIISGGGAGGFNCSSLVGCTVFSNLQTTVNNNVLDISNLQTTVGGHTLQIGSIRSDLSNSQGNITTIQGDIIDLQDQIDSMSGSTGGGGTITGTTNYIPKFNSTGTTDSNIFENPTTKFIGINTITPTRELSIQGKIGINDGTDSVFIGNGVAGTVEAGSTNNVAIGVNSLTYLSSYSNNNTAIGFNSGNVYDNVENVSIGSNAGSTLSGFGAIIIGYNSGLKGFGGLIPPGIGGCEGSILIGRGSKFGSYALNQIAIGDGVVSKGGGTTVIGNTNTTETHLAGNLNIGTIQSGTTNNYLINDGGKVKYKEVLDIESTKTETEAVFNILAPAKFNNIFCTSTTTIAGTLPQATTHKGKTITITSMTTIGVQVVSFNPAVPQVFFKNNSTADKSGYYSVTLKCNGSKWVITSFINI